MDGGRLPKAVHCKHASCVDWCAQHHRISRFGSTAVVLPPSLYYQLCLRLTFHHCHAPSRKSTTRHILCAACIAAIAVGGVCGHALLSRCQQAEQSLAHGSMLHSLRPCKKLTYRAVDCLLTSKYGSCYLGAERQPSKSWWGQDAPIPGNVCHIQSWRLVW